MPSPSPLVTPLPKGEATNQMGEGGNEIIKKLFHPKNTPPKPRTRKF